MTPGRTPKCKPAGHRHKNRLAYTAIFPIIAAIFRPTPIPKGVLARLDILGDLSGERPSKSDARSQAATCLKTARVVPGISLLFLC